MSISATHHGSGWCVVVVADCAEQTGRVRIFFDDGLSLAGNLAAADFQHGFHAETVHAVPVVIRNGGDVDIMWRSPWRFIMTLRANPQTDAPPAYTPEDHSGRLEALERRCQMLETKNEQLEALEQRCQMLETKNGQLATLINYVAMHPTITPGPISAAVILQRYDAPLAQADGVIKYIWLSRPCKDANDYETYHEALNRIINAGVSPRGFKTPTDRPTILGVWLARLAAGSAESKQGIINIIRLFLDAGADPDDPQTRSELQALDPGTQADFARLVKR